MLAVGVVVGQHGLQVFHLDAAELVLKKVEPDAGKLDKVRQTLSVHRGKTEALRGQVLALKNHLKLSD